VSTVEVSGGDAPLAAVEQWGASSAAAAAVAADGTVHHHGDTHRVLRVASVTKLCTAWAVLVAIEEGTVTLEDPLGPQGATVRHLLCHASGLDVDSDAVLAAPGTRRIYSNTGYDLLADHVGSSTGIPFGEYLHEAVLSPLGMTSSELRGSAAKDLFSSVEDLLRLATELAEPRLLAASTAQDACGVQFPDLVGVLPGWGRQEPCPWGLGPEVRGTKAPHWTGATASAATYGHFGGSGSLLWVDPVARVRCVAVCDREFDTWAVSAWPPFSDAVRAAYR
jgi:CubicO group peptidase (beta-lactamase class C family)